MKIKMEKGYSLCYFLYGGDLQEQTIKLYNQQTAWLIITHSHSYDIESELVTRTVKLTINNILHSILDIPTNFNISWDKYCININRTNNNLSFIVNNNIITTSNRTSLKFNETDVVMFKTLGMFTKVSLSSEALVPGSTQHRDNIHNWNLTRWNFDEDFKKNITNINLLKPLLMFIPVKQNFTSAYDTCSKLKAKIAGFLNESEWKEIYFFYKETYPDLDFVHFPYQKEDSDPTFNIYDNRILSGTFWVDKCESNFPSLFFAFNGTNCSSYFNTGVKNYYYFCNYPSPLVIKLNGLPKNIFIEELYYPNVRLKGFYIWLGLKGSIVAYDKGVWRGQSFNASVNVRATLDNLLLGKNQWEVQSIVSPQGNTSFLNLSMNPCKTEEFACDDGSCCAYKERCDGQYNCTDNSDEKDCNFIIRPYDYNREEILPSWGRSTVDLTINLHLLEVLSVNINSGRMDLKLNITLKWYDDRFNYQFLNEDVRQNVLTSDEFSTTWKPSLVYANKDPNPNFVNVMPEMSVELEDPYYITVESSYGTVIRNYPGCANPLYLSTVIRYFIVSVSSFHQK
jgi:hypothetical protein